MFFFKKNIICIVVSICVYVFIFCIFDFSSISLVTFGNLDFLSFNNFDLSTFNNLGFSTFDNLVFSTTTFDKIDFAMLVFNFLLCICYKYFTLSCFFVLLFCSNGLQFARLKFSSTYNLLIAILGELPCTYIWVTWWSPGANVFLKLR